MLTPKFAVNFALEPKLVPAPVLVPEPCHDKQRLEAELRATMDEIIALVVQRLHTVRSQPQPGVEQYLEMQIANARRRRDTLMELYMGRHSC